MLKEVALHHSVKTQLSRKQIDATVIVVCSHNKVAALEHVVYVRFLLHSVTLNNVIFKTDVMSAWRNAVYSVLNTSIPSIETFRNIVLNQLLL